MVNEWTASFKNVYEQARTIIETIIKIDADGQPAPPNDFIESYDDLKTLYESINNYPEAPNKDYKKALKDLKKTIEMCLKASEMIVKMIDDMNNNGKLAARMHLSSVIGYVNYANIYYGEFTKRLTRAGFFSD